MINSQPALSQVLVKTKADGTQTYYVYGLGLIGQEQAGSYLTYHFDFRGSTVALTDETGIVTEQFQYSPYGVLVGGEADTTPFLFNGMYGVMSDGNGLYYMRARYYHPEIRRFVNQDILLGYVSEGQTLNRYAFVTGQPVSLIDPFGLQGMPMGRYPFDWRVLFIDMPDYNPFVFDPEGPYYGMVTIDWKGKLIKRYGKPYGQLQCEITRMSVRIHEDIHVSQLTPYQGIPWGYILANIELEGGSIKMELEAYKAQRKFLLEACGKTAALSPSDKYELHKMLEMVQDSIRKTEEYLKLPFTKYEVCREWLKHVPKFRF